MSLCDAPMLLGSLQRGSRCDASRYPRIRRHRTSSSFTSSKPRIGFVRWIAGRDIVIIVKKPVQVLLVVAKAEDRVLCLGSFGLGGLAASKAGCYLDCFAAFLVENNQQRFATNHRESPKVLWLGSAANGIEHQQRVIASCPLGVSHVCTSLSQAADKWKRLRVRNLSRSLNPHDTSAGDSRQCIALLTPPQ
jgi:hypothetical protein